MRSHNDGRSEGWLKSDLVEGIMGAIDDYSHHFRDITRAATHEPAATILDGDAAAGPAPPGLRRAASSRAITTTVPQPRCNYKLEDFHAMEELSLIHI